MSWRKNLLQLTQSQNKSERISVIGVGHPLFGDDYIGAWITDRLKEIFPEKSSTLQIITAESNPENIIGPIVRFQPTHLILLDAISGTEFGEIGVIPWKTNVALDTYLFSAPLSNFCTFIYNECQCEITLIGVQIDFPGMSMEISPLIKKSGQQIVDELAAQLKSLN